MWARAVVFVWLILCAAPSRAEPPTPKDYTDLDLRQLLEVVVTPTKQPQSVEDAPAQVEVITCGDIQRFGYHTVADALRSIPGVTIIDDHMHHHMGIRGFVGDFESPNDIVKFMINGQPVSFRPNAAGFLGVELIPIEAVKRIEVLRGPGSALYGANAFLGVVNIITFDGSERWEGDPAEPGTHRHAVFGETALGANSHTFTPGGGGGFTSRGAWNAVRYFAAMHYDWSDRSGLEIPGLHDMIAEHMHSEDSTLHPPAAGYPSPGWQGTREKLMTSCPSRNDTSHAMSGYMLFEHRSGAGSSLRLDGSIQYMDRHGEFQEFSALTHSNRLTYFNGFARLRYTIDPGDAGFALALSLAGSGGRPTTRDHVVDPLTPGSFKRRRFGYKALDAVAEVSYRFGPGNAITVGADYTVDHENLLTLEVMNLTTDYKYREPGFGEKLFHSAGFYLQGVYTPIEALSFTVGSRADYNNVIGCNDDDWACLGKGKERGLLRLSNRAGATWNVGWGGLYLKAMYGSSFRPPSPYQLYHNPVALIGSTGNPDLLPQTADTVELVLGSRPIPGLHVNLGLYYTWIHDLVFSYLDASSFKIRNADAHSHGLEASIRWTSLRRVSVFANASVVLEGLLEPKRLAGETDLLWETSVFNTRIPFVMFPKWTLNAGVSLHVPEGHLRVSLLLHAIGERRASIANNLLYNTTSLHKTYELPPYVLGSLVVRSEALRWLGMATVISAGIRYAPGGQVDTGRGGIDIPGPGPQLFMRLEHRF